MIQLIRHLNLQQRDDMLLIVNQKAPIIKNLVKFTIDSIKSNLCYYSDAYTFVAADITVADGNINMKVAFKSCATFKTC